LQKAVLFQVADLERHLAAVGPQLARERLDADQLEGRSVGVLVGFAQDTDAQPDGVHFQNPGPGRGSTGGSTPDVGLSNLLRGRRVRRGDRRVPIAPHPPDRGEEVAQLLVRRAVAQSPAEIVAATAEEASEELAFGREARSRAAAAEWLGHGSDDANL